MRAARFVPLACALALAGCGRAAGDADKISDKRKDASPMSTADHPLEPSAEAPLPVEPSSRSELLTATHLFTVEVLSAQLSPWARGADGLEHRRLELSVKLGEILKGALDRAAGEVFPLEVEQRRESAHSESDYHGIWSHTPVAQGSAFLVVSRGAEVSGSPAALMKEPACKKLLPRAQAVEAHLARQAEQVFQQRLAAPPGDPLAADRALAAFVAPRLSHASDLFGRYLWSRVEPRLLRDRNGGAIVEVSGLLTAPEATYPFQVQLVADLDRLARLPGVAPAVLPQVTRALFTLLADPQAQPLHARLVDVYLAGMLFHDGAPTLQAHAVFPEAADRARFRQALAPSTSEAARRIAEWLGT